HIALAMALAAGLSLGARADDMTTTRDVNKDAVKTDSHKAEAKRHIVTTDVALEQAKLGLQGLYALADDKDGAWDVDHAKTLLNDTEKQVKLAVTHLQHLTSLAADKKDAPTDLTRAQTKLASLQAELKNLESPIKAGLGETPMRGSGGDVGIDK